MSFLRLYLVFGFFLGSLFVQGQGKDALSRLKSFVRYAEEFNRYYPQEKVYLHLDNTGYYLGERIWFKAYVVTAPFHWLTTMSQTLYVELLSPEGYVVETKKLRIEAGQCHGDFYLDRANYSGYYEIRAYTRWMLNFRDDDGIIMANADVPGIFSRVFPVFDPPEVAGDYSKEYVSPRFRENSDSRENLSPVLLQFYPEGGHLVKGLPSIVAFQAMDRKGRFISLEGRIIDNRGKYVTSFSSVHRGMGSFVFTPNARHYHAEVKIGENFFRYALPEIEKEGIIMHVNNLLDDHLRIEVSARGVEPVDTLGLVLMNNGQVYAFEVISVNTEKSSDLKLSRDSLPAGVYEVVLFNRKGRPLCERKIFIRGKGPERIKIQCGNVKPAYLPYEKIGLDFQLYQNGTPLCENHTFSLSVRDSSSEVKTWYTGNAETEMLLSSEVRGFLPDVGYYFSSSDLQRRQHLDLLLQVQGWRRYSWEKMSGVDRFKFRHPVEHGITLQGRLLSDRDGFRYYNKLLGNAKVRWRMYNDSVGLYGNLLTDSLGRYRLVFDDLQGSWHINLFSDDRRLEKEFLPNGPHPWATLSVRAQICVDRLFSPHCKSYSYYEWNRPDPEIRDYILLYDTLIRNISLSEAEAVGNYRGRIYHRPGVRANIRDLTEEFMDVNLEERGLSGEVLAGYLMDKMKFSGGSYCLIRDSVLMKEGELGSIKRNIIFGSSQGFLYRPLDWYFGWTKMLDSIEINVDYAYRDSLRQKGGGCLYFRSDRYEAREIPDYVLRLTTYRDGEKRELSPLTRNFIFDGYAKVEEYRSPDYSARELPDSGDYRRTLYWNPDVRTDSLGRAYIEFYNNSTCRKLILNAETITPDGRIGTYPEKKED